MTRHSLQVGKEHPPGAFAGGTAVRYEKAPPIGRGLLRQPWERGALSAQDPIWERWDP